MITQRFTWTGVGMLLALTAGSPALADDTELLLVTPATSDDNKPNILFILDTSGSMADPVPSRAPYVSSQTYTGACDSNSVYWAEVDVTPICAGSTHSVAKDAFVCDAAVGRLAGIGIYSDTMVQYRPTADPDVSRWQELEPGNAGRVECQEDSGVHGDGTAGELWASNGSDGNDFTSDSTLEIAWGSAPAAVTYTVYDGNYLNWKDEPTTLPASCAGHTPATPVPNCIAKIDILKAVTQAVLNSVDNVNVGVMRFNDNAGGPVIKAISDLDTTRQQLLTTVENLTAVGATPLSETMYESALYWRGMPAYYGETIDEFPTDPDALDTAEPENYRQPETNVCSKNFNVLVTDGQPNNDEETPTLFVNQPLPDYATALGRSNCDGSGQGLCLDDVTEYLGAVDIDTVMEGDQFVTTHTIGFDIDLPILEQAAADSGGSYFVADDVQSLALAMLKIISDITETSLSFAAPAVSVNAFNRTQNLNDLYLTVFSAKSNVHWPGNLKKYKVSSVQTVDATGQPVTTTQIVDANSAPAVNPADGFFFNSTKSIWTDGAADGSDVIRGGAAHELPASGLRKLYTNNGTDNDLKAAVNVLTPSNVDNFEPADFGLTGAAGDPTEADMINWMLGVDVRNEDDNDATTVRNVMGDPLHSQPAAVVYGGSSSTPDVVVFTATNDGYLHAIDGDTGAELWAFVPKELLSDMNRLYFDPNSNFKHYGIDGNIVPVIFDQDKDGEIEAGTDFIYILFGLRRGGHSYYALDVTNRDSPRLLWTQQYPEFGESWSTPVVTRVNVDDARLNAQKAVVIIGGGYDTVHDTPAPPTSPDAQGAGIHMLDLVTGERLWWAGPSGSGANLERSRMTRAIPSQIRVVDVSGDGQADRMYAADLGGQVWRFDITNGQPPATLVAGGVIAQLGAEGLGSPTAADNRRFYNSPDVSIFTDPFQGKSFISVSIGSGYRAHPFNDDAVDRFFSIRDGDVFNQLSQPTYNAYDIVTIDDLVEVSGLSRVVIDADKRGWKFTLPANQKVITNSTTFDNSVFFVGFTPDANNENPCQPTNGINFLYQVSVVNGDPIVNNLDAPVPNPDAERVVTQLEQGGIAPAPTFLFPGSTDPNYAPPPIYCVGVECFDPGFVNNPVRTLWTQKGIE